MNPIFLCSFFSLLALMVALCCIFRFPKNNFSTISRYFLILTLLFTGIIALANCLEYAEIIDSFESYDDYFQALVVPFFLFALCTDAYEKEAMLRKKSQEMLNITKEKNTGLMHEVHHRVKNNLQLISSMLHLGIMSQYPTGMPPVLDSCFKRIRSLAAVHEHLCHSAPFPRVICDQFLPAFVKGSHCNSLAVKDLICLDEIDDIIITVDAAIPLSLMLYELLAYVSENLDMMNHESRVHLRFVREEGLIALYFFVKEVEGLIFPPSDTDFSGADFFKALVSQLKGEIQELRAGECGLVIRFPAKLLKNNSARIK